MTYVSYQIRPTMFKKVPDGYIFRAPNPRLLGATPHYLVTEAQKAQLVKILTRPNHRSAVLVIVPTLWLLVLVIAGNIAATRAFVLAAPMLTITVLGVLMVVTTMLALHIENRPMQRRLKPFLAGLARTDERITNRELRDAIDNTTSVRRSLLSGIVLTIICLIYGNSILRSPDRDGLYYLGAVLLIVLGAFAAAEFARAIRIAKNRKC
jgi:hypothetical protein